MLSLDLSAIMAGSGIRGAFEEKFKALIRDIEEEVGFALHSFIMIIDGMFEGRECDLLY